MILQNPDEVNFFKDNLLLIALVAVVIFGYLLMIIKKRWRQGFLHRKHKD